MYEYIGAAISYVYQIAVILFVLREFGFIKVQLKTSAPANGESQGSEEPQNQNNPLGAMLQSMGPMVENMMKNMGQQQNESKSSDQPIEASVEVVEDVDE